MKHVPFYPNRPNNTSCMLACFRSVLEYFSGRQYSWEELEELTGFESKRAAWTVKMWVYLATHRYDIRMVEGFDYRKYYAEGDKYLRSFLKPQELEWQIKHTNLLTIRPLLPTFLETVNQDVRSPQLKDIDDMLNDGYLVTVTLNSRILNDKPGYTAHMILVYGKNGGEYVAHDPGLPPHESRHIPETLLFEAMGGKENTVEVSGIRKQA